MKPNKLPQQTSFMARLHELRDSGLGWEDIYVKLKADGNLTPEEHIRNFVLRNGK